MRVTVDHNDGHAVVTVYGRIFADTLDPLRDALTPLLDTDRPRIVLDLTGVEICDSSGLNLFVHSHDTATGRSGWLRLACLRPMVWRVIEITNLHELIPVYPTVEKALAA